MKVWQIATGEPGRDYRKLFFDHDIMILGPGEPGDATNHNYATGAANSSERQVYNFVIGPEPGDRIIMRFAHDVIGIGQVPEADDNQYHFNDVFRCVYGWNLSHVRRVIWAERYDLGELANVFRHAKQKPSFTQVHENHIVLMVQAINESFFLRPIKPLPVIDSVDYSDEELGVELFRAGLSNKNIEDILKALQQAQRLCAWYRSEPHKWRPSEHEIISHVTLPLFLGLGWSHQQIAIEWNRVDMAFFKSTPTNKDNCVMILEAKGLGQALSEILEQPLSYIKHLYLEKVKYLLTTDGANLFVYGKNGHEWNLNPIGYVNVLSLQKEYILPKGTNVVNTLVNLQPGMV